MNISSSLNFNNISFQKNKKAKCHILKDGLNISCNIYELDKNDYDYFEKLIFKKAWQNARYIMYADKAVNNCENETVYIIEDDDNKCLGYCVVGNYNGKKNLEYIETIPKQKAKNKKRNMCYIGETLLAFLMKNFNKNDDFYIKSVLQDAIPFYEKYHLKYLQNGNYDFIIGNKEKESLIGLNKEHTGEMELVG